MKHNTHTKEGIAQFDMQVNREHGIWARECVIACKHRKRDKGRCKTCKFRKQDKGLGQGRSIRHAW